MGLTKAFDLSNLKRNKFWQVERKRYRFYLYAEDSSTGKRRRSLFGLLNAEWILHPENSFDVSDPTRLMPVLREQVRLSRSGCFSWLKPKARVIAIWLCERAIIRHWRKKDPVHVPALPANVLRYLHGKSQQATAMIQDLEEMLPILRRIEEVPMLHHLDFTPNVEKAITALRGFAKRTAEEPSRSDHREYDEISAREAWPWGRAGLAYALYLLWEKDSNRAVLAKDVYKEIGSFERDFLDRRIGDSSGDTYDTVRRQVYGFSRTPGRIPVGRIVARLRKAEWFGLHE